MDRTAEFEDKAEGLEQSNKDKDKLIRKYQWQFPDDIPRKKNDCMHNKHRGEESSSKGIENIF